MLSQNYKFKLVESSRGRIFWNLLGLCRGGQWKLHCISIWREICKRSQKTNGGRMPAPATKHFWLIAAMSIFGMFIGFPEPSFAVPYFVAGNGADTNSGTFSQPFLTIQKAATVARAGDTINIHAGVYRESVAPGNSGTSGAPIIFQAYSNEMVTISGADVIASNSWAVYSGHIYSNAMNWNLRSNNQVFVDGQMMNEARYPNTSLDVSHPVKLVATAGAYTGTSGLQTGTVFNASLTQPTNYWVGGMINITIGKVWNSQTCPITGSGTGQVSFAWTPGSENYLPTNGNPFFLFGRLSELDSPGEWYFTNSILYLWTPQSDSPAGHLVEAKHRMLGFDLSGKSWITVGNIHFVACAVSTSSSTRNCVLNQLDMIYPVHLDQMGAFTQGTNAGVTLLGVSNVLQNSLIAYSSGSGVYVAGTNNVVTNNLIHDVDYSGNNGAGISTDSGYRVFGGTNTVIAGNTIYITGGCPMDLGGITAGYVHHNDLSLGGLQITDFGAVYQYTTAGQGTRIAYNVCHDVDAPSNVSGITNNNSKGIYLDGGSTGFVVDHNVIWNALTGMVLNSGNITNSAHLILNNTVLGDATSLGWSGTPELGTVFQNNIFRTNNAFGIGSVATNNLLKSTDPKFVNTAANNYQLQSGSPAIEAGLPYSPYTDGYAGSNPDQGAYEYGQTAWTAGSTVNETPVFFNLSGNQTVAYGATNVTLIGVLGARLGQFPADGEIVSITINGKQQNAIITNGNGSFLCNFNPATNPVAGSPYAINYFYAGSAVFNAASNNTTTLTINPAPLTVSASNPNRFYGATNPVFTASYSGFVNGETTSVLAGIPSLTTMATTNSGVGSYPIVATNGTLSATNYGFAFVNGTLTVNAAALTVTANNTNKVYDGVPFSGGNGFSYAGFVNGETPTVLGGTLNYGGASQGATAVGSYSIIPSGLTAANYAISYSNGTLVITSPALAARNLTWDIVGGDGATISNGSGTWDTTNTNWNNGTINVAWNNAAPDNATFGKGTNNAPPWVTACVVTLGVPISVGNLMFTNWNGTTNINCQITGSTLSLSNTPTITTRSDGQISSVLTGSGFVKDGAGTLRVDGTSPSYSGNIVVSNGQLQVGNNGGGGNLGLGTITLVDPGTFVVRRQGTLTVSNVIAGATSGSVGFQLNGSAVIALASASTYFAAGTYLQPTASGTVGTLKLGTDNALPSGTAFTINNNGPSVQTFDLAGFNQTLGSLATGVNGSTANSRITNSSGTTSTLTIGGTNTTTFAGLLAGNLAFVKSGSGMLTLTASNTFAGSTIVNGGTLNLSGSISNAAQVFATNAATLQLSGGIITASLVRIYTNAFLLGCGTINGVLINDGTLLSSCGTNMTLNGAVTNNGTMRLTAGTQLIASGPCVNNGLLDLINATGSLPPGFVNNGVVLDSSSVQVSAVSISGTDVQAQILSVVGHTYQMQRSSTLNPPSWADLGVSQSGTGGVLTFTNSGALSQPQGFYRFKVN